MKTATVRDLRNNFSKLEAWLAEGEEIQIEKRGLPVAMLSRLTEDKESPEKRPDFAARRKALWGDRVFTEEQVQKLRDLEAGQYEK